MKPQYRSLLMFVTTVAYAVTGEWATAQGKSDGKRGRLPAPVAKAIDDNCPGAEIAKLDVEKEAGITFYDIEFSAGRGEIDVAQDGTVLDVATLVDMKDVPEAAAAVFRRAASRSAIKQIEKSEVRAEIKKEGKGGKISPLATPEYV